MQTKPTNFVNISRTRPTISENFQNLKNIFIFQQNHIQGRGGERKKRTKNKQTRNKQEKQDTRGTLYIFGYFPNFDLNKLYSGGNQSKAPYYQHVLGEWILQSPEYAGLRLHADPNHVRKRNFAKIKVIRQGGYIFYIL